MSAPNSEQLLQRGRDRLQSVYEAVERGEEVDWERHDLLGNIEMVQIGRAFASECAQSIRDADDGFKRRAEGTA